MNPVEMKIDILDFVKTGTFGFLKLGETKKEIISQGLPPEDWLNGETKESSRIWRFGTIELHFDNGENLSGIFTDYISDIDGGNSIAISNKWILSNEKNTPDLLRTIRELNTLGVNYTKTTFDIGYIELTLSNGVYFTFDHPDDHPDREENYWMMTVIGKKCFMNTKNNQPC